MICSRSPRPCDRCWIGPDRDKFEPGPFDSREIAVKGLDLDVDKRNLQGVLTEYKHLQVPLFQRPYSWDKEQWSQLWDDLTTNLDTDYLMGGIVLCGGTDGEQIIDGQQRIGTLTVLAAVCRDKAATLKSTDAIETVTEFHNKLVAQKELGSKESAPYLSS